MPSVSWCLIRFASTRTTPPHSTCTRDTTPARRSSGQVCEKKRPSATDVSRLTTPAGGAESTHSILRADGVVGGRSALGGLPSTLSASAPARQMEVRSAIQRSEEQTYEL